MSGQAVSLNYKEVLGRDALFLHIDTLEKFGSVSGLRLNIIKTEAFWIGSMAGENKKLFPEMA